MEPVRRAPCGTIGPVAELGWNWRFIGWPGHTTVEAFYDDRWHYLDVFLKFYAWMPDPKNPGRRTIAGQDDLAANPKALLFDAFTLDKSRKVAYLKGNEFEMIGDKANWQRRLSWSAVTIYRVLRKV